MGFSEIKMNVLIHYIESENIGENHIPRVERKIQSPEQNDVVLIWTPGAKAKEGRKQE